VANRKIPTTLSKCAAAADGWDSALTTLEHNLRSAGTAKTLVATIIQVLQDWRADTETTMPTDPTLCAAVESLLEVGRRAFMDGFHALERANAHESISTGRKISKQLWASKTIRWIWEAPWTMWEHRNDTLHRTNQIDPAMQTIDAQIREELSMGAL